MKMYNEAKEKNTTAYQLLSKCSKKPWMNWNTARRCMKRNGKDKATIQRIGKVWIKVALVKYTLKRSRGVRLPNEAIAKLIKNLNSN